MAIARVQTIQDVVEATQRLPCLELSRRHFQGDRRSVVEQSECATGAAPAQLRPRRQNGRRNDERLQRLRFSQLG